MTTAEKTKLIEIYETMVKTLAAELAVDELALDLDGLIAGAHENLANAKA